MSYLTFYRLPHKDQKFPFLLNKYRKKPSEAFIAILRILINDSKINKRNEGLYQIAQINYNIKN